ncbi:MAG: hypothetical protein KAI16_00365 [Candidatus Pacebacteria bacterium]|nr:hypothetical protein [Candidatus Paceibacterota bacterium]
MKRFTIVKIILITFFAIFFAFLFWYFYDPVTDNTKDELGESPSFFSLMPFGDMFTDDDEIIIDNESSDTKNDDLLKPEEKKYKMPALRQISNTPSAGAFIQPLLRTEIFDLNINRKGDNILELEEKHYEIRYVDMKNNHVYQTYNFTPKVTRISNITIPKIFEAKFFDKDNFIIRYNNNFNILKTYAINLSEKTAEEIESQSEEERAFSVNQKKFQGIFLSDNIKQISLLENSNQLFYLVDDVQGIKGYTSDRNGNNKKEVFSNPIEEFNINWYHPDNIFLSTKASKDADSVFFNLNLKNNTMSLIDTSIVGGVGLPNDNLSKVLYSGFVDTNNTIKLFTIDTINKSKYVYDSKTLVEKCVWSKDNIHVFCAIPNYLDKNQPDSWYKGKNYFSDEVRKINTKSGSEEYIFIPETQEELFDMIDLKLDSTERFLYFKDKKTDFYWSIDLKQIQDKKY